MNDKAFSENFSSPVFCAQIQECAKVLADVGFGDYAKVVEKVMQGMNRDQYSIAVVGEFNRGKSTLINKLMSRDILPVGDLPTTAVMTKIQFGNDEEVRLFDESGNLVSCNQLKESKLDELSLHHFDNKNYKGRVEITLPDEWLKKTGVSIYDTPGAGDLEEDRAQLIGDMLWGCDGVILTINATQALSMTEKLFIEERIIARQFSSIMVVVSKLDLIEESERADVMRFIKFRLNDWKLPVPVYVSDISCLPRELQGEFGGIDEIKVQIEAWCADSNRLANRRMQGKANVSSIMETALASLTSQLALLEEESIEKRMAMITQKKAKLQEAKLAWDMLNTEMQKKCTACYSLLTRKADEYCATICERLQFEAGHAGDPKRWWQEDYPYRSKIELSNMAANLEGIIGRQVLADARWYNNELNRIFKIEIPYASPFLDGSAQPVTPNNVNGSLNIENLDRQRVMWRIGSAVLMISGAAFCSVTGCWPLIATMGIGTGTGILSEKILKDKVETQREAMKKEIAARLPNAMHHATAQSERRLTEAYEKIIAEGEQYEQKWVDGQKRAINGTADSVGSVALNAIRERISKLKDTMSRL